MFASTTQARALLRKAFKLANSETPRNTYTEKTTERDPNRRSVVFAVNPDFADEVIHQARDFFQEAGFTKSVPKLYCNAKMFGTELSMTTYVRVIAYVD